MESEKLSASSSASSDRLVKTEIEAAETLADLAQLAMRETASACDSSEKWWKKGKRGRRRLTRESPTGDSEFNALDSLSKCPDFSPGQAVIGQQPHQQISISEPEKIDSNVCSGQVKMEEDADIPKTSNVFTTSCSLTGCNKSRRNLTEEEKEARRVRRVLANRESARQTIRRRQALCEELTRKAANLTMENENLKREKELALKEYQSLETKNKHLKAQIAKSTITQVEKTTIDCDSSVADIMSSSSHNGPWFLYNNFPVTQLFWPPVVHSSNPAQYQHMPQSSIPIPSNVSLPFSSESELCHKQANHTHDNQTQNPLYMFPCPWFFRLPEFGHGQSPPSIGLKDKQGYFPVDKQCCNTSSLNMVANVDNHAALPFKVKTEAFGLTEVRPMDDSDDTAREASLDGSEQKTECQSMEKVHGQLACMNHNEVSSAASLIANSLLEKKQEQVKPGKNLVDALAAAEARKRRKELTKLKSIQSRQCRMHC